MKLYQSNLVKTALACAISISVLLQASAAINNEKSADDSDVVVKHDKVIDLAPETKHFRSSRYIAYYMKTSHFKKQVLDDEQSALVLDNFIELLDANKAYFLASDIKSFEQYRFKLDDAIWTGLVQPAYHIYSVFQKRWHERNNFALSLLEKERTWILCNSNNDIIWVLGKRLDNRYRTKNNSENVLKIQFTSK